MTTMYARHCARYLLHIPLYILQYSFQLQEADAISPSWRMRVDPELLSATKCLKLVQARPTRLQASIPSGPQGIQPALGSFPYYF